MLCLRHPQIRIKKSEESLLSNDFENADVEGFLPHEQRLTQSAVRMADVANLPPPADPHKKSRKKACYILLLQKFASLRAASSSGKCARYSVSILYASSNSPMYSAHTALLKVAACPVIVPSKTAYSENAS